MGTTIVIAVSVALLIVWAILLGWQYQRTEDEMGQKEKEDFFMIGIAGVMLIMAWPLTLGMAAILGIIYGIAYLSRKITRRKNGFSTRG